jgi:hypothetical protein
MHKLIEFISSLKLDTSVFRRLLSWVINIAIVFSFLCYQLPAYSKSLSSEIFEESTLRDRFPSELFVAQSERRCVLWIFCKNIEKGRGRTDTTISGGKSGSCSNVEIIALVPAQIKKEDFSQNLKTLTSLQFSHPPILFLYITPQRNFSIKLAEFTLQDKRGNTSTSVLNLPSNSDIVTLMLSPKQLEMLQDQQIYHWFFSVICDSRRPSRNPSVDNFIQKKTFLANEETKYLSDGQKIRINENNNLWYDTFSSLIFSHCKTKANDAILQEYWSEFIRWSNDIGINEQVWDSYCENQSEKMLQEIKSLPPVSH